MNRDESLVGFYLTNTRTGETTMYKVTGAIESAGVTSAEGKVQQYGYRGTYPILINLQKQPTYFITLLDKKGLIKSYAFVNVENYNVVGVGETLQQAYDDYVEILSRDSGLNFLENAMQVELEGTIDRIGMVMKNDTTIYLFTLEGNPITFIGTTEKNQTIALAKAGDRVKITYIEDLLDTITISTFENLTIQEQQNALQKEDATHLPNAAQNEGIKDQASESESKNESEVDSKGLTEAK